MFDIAHSPHAGHASIYSTVRYVGMNPGVQRDFEGGLSGVAKAINGIDIWHADLAPKY